MGLCLVRRFPTQVGFRDGEEITEAEALTAVGVLQSACPPATGPPFSANSKVRLTGGRLDSLSR